MPVLPLASLSSPFFNILAPADFVDPLCTFSIHSPV
jgi:hypothetical protein